MHTCSQPGRRTYPRPRHFTAARYQRVMGGTLGRDHQARRLMCGKVALALRQGPRCAKRLQKCLAGVEHREQRAHILGTFGRSVDQAAQHGLRGLSRLG